jgi:hypothetical protein
MTSTQSIPLAELGHAAVSPDRLRTLVGRCLGADQPDVTSVEVTVVDYPAASIATGALLRCHGTAVVDGQDREWSIFVKMLQSARLWPMLHMIPEEHRQQMIAGFPWRVEIEAYLSRLPEVLPEGFRFPRIYDVIEIDDERAAIWMEDVQASDQPWSLHQFEHAARLLGILAGRRPLGTDLRFGLAPENQAPGFSLRMTAFGRVKMGAGGMLADDALWTHPALVAALQVTGESTIRAELRAAISHVDAWMDTLDTLPQTYAHGDASPQNLLVPVDDPDTFVIIDFGFTSPLSVGFDLGQLLVGFAHSELMDTTELAAVQAVIVPAYTEGLRSTGFPATAEQVQQGFVLSVLVRSLFTAIPLEELHQPDSPRLRERLVNRIRLARYLLDLCPTTP